MSFTQRMRSHPLGPRAAGTHQSTVRLTLLSCILLGALIMALLARPPVALADQAPEDSPVLLPVPQSVAWQGPAVPLTGSVEIVTLGRDAGDDDVAAVRELVTDAGGTVAASGAKASARIVLGSADADLSAWLPASQSVPEQAEGYLLATMDRGVPTAVLLGRDADGLFHATTVLGQLIEEGAITGAQVRDWPTMAVRGVVEGFYGPPWSHQARLDTISYMGTQRMNTYIYTPKDDPYLRKNWREPYPAGELGRMEELSRAAQEAHVDLVVALSPGDSICYTSQEDYEAAVAVLEQLRGIGITSFYLAFDDLLGGDGLPAPLCESDTAQFGQDRLVALAGAQAHFLNRVQNEYIRPHGLPDLWTVPTHYVGMEATPYITAFGSALDDSIRVQWTGRAVVTDSITTAQAAQAKKNYDTSSMVIWDNFPANDGENQARLFLGAMPARSTDLSSAVAGITINPMIQPYASRLAMADYAGYSWNPAAHSPQAARDAAIADIVGDSSGATWETMQAFVDVQEQWEYSGWKPTDAWGDIYRFIWASQGQDDADLTARATVLRARLQLLSTAPTTLASVEEEGFYTDAKPWIEVTSQWAKADLAAIDLILALRRGDEAAAQKAHDTMEAMVAATATGRVDSLDEQGNAVANAVTPKVGENAMGELVDEARKAWRNR
ncbi:beta-N-acetylglucosaminidase domain-containing protein [Actinomyces bowdenii]|uniref:beta-N-acetylhexosaminidase family protein n=1 Tax=Actinomyces bowdenii TaxID=131109 RepID=UPI001ABBE5C4|nr:beta-N-acetylglucosaminidase domain-containing protein [Actinomyces bowdenii]MBO3725712.1 beta-N-acetylglucosaminidase domain-containing protein [Actinomyces bowdenii]